MALLRRRRDKQQGTAPPDEQAKPRPSTPAASADEWRPATMAPRAPAPPATSQQRRESAAEWMPEGVKAPPPGFRNARSSSAIEVPQEVRDAAKAEREAREAAKAAPTPVPPPAADPAPPPAADPAPLPAEAMPSQRDELHARIASLEGQIAAAKASDSSEQAATIRALQLRLSSLEDELDKGQSGYAKPAAPGATSIRILIAVLLFLVIAGSPLFMSRRSICHPHGRPQTHWAIVKPFDDSGKPGCDNQLGGSVLLDSIGLK